MSKEPFYPLENNYEKVEKIFGEQYLLKSFLDELDPKEVIDANKKLADVVYGDEISNLIRKKHLRQLTAIRDSILNKYDKLLEKDMRLDDYGMILIRPETMGCIDEYKSFLERNGFEIIFQKNTILDFEKYFMLYHDGMMLGLKNNDELFDFPTRTFNYINNICCLIIVKSKNRLNVPVSSYLHTFKGKHGSYVKNTLRGDVAYNALKDYVIDGVTIFQNANVPLDPIGAYRALVRGKVDSDGWHDKVDLPILFYSGQSVHIPNRSEIEKDLSVICTEEDIKLIKK